MRNISFNEWINSFKKSINNYDYYVDFDKVYQRANSYKTELFLMNSLIGSHNIREDFSALVQKYPHVVETIPILLAVRSWEIYCIEGTVGHTYVFNGNSSHIEPIERYIEFMDKVGLFDLIENHLINNLYDYVIGIEVGLDSNARKNRGGHQMEDLVESYIKKTSAEYQKEAYISDIEQRYGVDLSSISNNNMVEKRFDFVVHSQNHIYLIETNFYGAGGSKLNETARSYKMIALESRNIPNVDFVWITDGIGWRGARGNLKETFESMEHIYCLKDLEDGVLSTLFG